MHTIEKDFIKVSPGEPPTDLCQRSIDILKDKCEVFLSKNFGSKDLWFVDHYSTYPRYDSGPIDLVFFGNFLRRFLESGNWPQRNYRFWALSQSVKDVFVRLIGVPEKNIQIIPRYELFPCVATANHFPKWGEPFTLIFGGRLSPTKNLESLIWTNYFLQKDHRLPVGLVLCGNFDDQIHPDRGRRERGNYKKLILNLIEELDWRIPPLHYEGLDQIEWTRLDLARPVYTSFSTFAYEDFGVSLAQAQSLGWPCLISNWGGHRDVIGSNVLKIYPLHIGNTHEPREMIALKARNLANLINQSLRNGIIDQQNEIHDNKPDLRAPADFDIFSIDQIRRNFIEKVGPDLQKFCRYGADHFADTKSGKNFFGKYRYLFSGQDSSHSILILVNDFHMSEDPRSKNIRTISELCMLESLRASKPVTLTSMVDLDLQDCRWSIFNVEKIIIPFYSEALIPILKSWIDANISASLIIFVNKEQQTDGVGRLQSILRTSDQVHIYHDPYETIECLNSNPNLT